MSKFKLNRYIILETLAELGEASIENLLNFLINSPGVFFKKYGRGSSFWYPKIDVNIDLVSKAKFYTMISKLKSAGLVAKNNNGTYKNTKIGKEYLKEKPTRVLRYQSLENTDPNNVILVIFDIPEYMKKMREWLRFQLKDLGFRMLQQSVWYSNNLLPKEFIDDLETFKLLPHVHILSVSKKGTLSDWFKRVGNKKLS